jgi:hypothetical protein
MNQRSPSIGALTAEPSCSIASNGRSAATAFTPRSTKSTSTQAPIWHSMPSATRGRTLDRLSKGG